jgi:hypothetical protein
VLKGKKNQAMSKLKYIHKQTIDVTSSTCLYAAILLASSSPTMTFVYVFILLNVHDAGLACDSAQLSC